MWMVGFLAVVEADDERKVFVLLSLSLISQFRSASK